MRISDWSSDVCSSDLAADAGAVDVGRADSAGLRVAEAQAGDQAVDDRGHDVDVEEAGGGDQRQQRVQPQPVGCLRGGGRLVDGGGVCGGGHASWSRRRSEEHTSELQSLMRISYAVFCLKKKKQIYKTKNHT